MTKKRKTLADRAHTASRNTLSTSFEDGWLAGYRAALRDVKAHERETELDRRAEANERDAKR